MYLSNSVFIISTTSSGNFWMFLWLRSIVTPGFKSLLTPLASAALVSFSARAFFMASWARATTWFADNGAELDDDDPLEGPCRSTELLGNLLTVAEGAVRCVWPFWPFGPFSGIGRPVDCVAAPKGTPAVLSMVRGVWVKCWFAEGLGWLVR